MIICAVTVLRKHNCAILGEWLSGVRYLEANMYAFGARICPLSGIRNPEVSASRRLLIYYSYGIFNP